MQVADLVFDLDTEYVDQFAEISGVGQSFRSAFRVGYNHADDTVLRTVIDDRTENVDILFGQKTGDVLDGTFLVLRIYGRSYCNK